MKIIYLDFAGHKVDDLQFHEKYQFRIPFSRTEINLLQTPTKEIVSVCVKYSKVNFSAVLRFDTFGDAVRYVAKLRSDCVREIDLEKAEKFNTHLAKIKIPK